MQPSWATALYSSKFHNIYIIQYSICSERCILCTYSQNVYWIFYFILGLYHNFTCYLYWLMQQGSLSHLIVSYLSYFILYYLVLSFFIFIRLQLHSFILYDFPVQLLSLQQEILHLALSFFSSLLFFSFHYIITLQYGLHLRPCPQM